LPVMLRSVVAYTRLGELEKASADYRLALTLLAPGNERRIACLAAAGNQPRDYARERTNLEKALERDPDNALLCNNLAWFYVTGPADLRAPEKALALVRKAIARNPGAVYRNTLGVAYYRLARYREAIDCFEQNLKEGQQYAAWDLFFLAMSYHGLKEASRARDCYDRAIQWWQTQTNLTPAQVAELKSFQAEGRALLNQDNWAKGEVP